MEHDRQAKYDKRDEGRFQATQNKIELLVSNYSRILIVQCTIVGSSLLQKIRKKLREEAEMVRGKVVSKHLVHIRQLLLILKKKLLTTLRSFIWH